MVEQPPVWTGKSLQVEILLGECEPDGIKGPQLRGGEGPGEGERGGQVAVSCQPVWGAACVAGEIS